MGAHQRSGGRFAYCANLERSSKQGTAQCFTECCSANSRTPAFQSCRISSQGRDLWQELGRTPFQNRFRSVTAILLFSLKPPADPSRTKPFISFRSLSVTHGHGTQTLHGRCAKQNDRAKIFHCFRLENKASSRSAPRTTSVASLHTGVQRFFLGGPALRVFNNPMPKSVTRRHALPVEVTEGQSCNLCKKNTLAIR